MSDRDDEKAVPCICDTSEGIVPSGESGKDSESPSCPNTSFIGVFASWLKIADGQKKERQVERKEQEKERHGRFECAEQEKSSEYEPALV
jgi:hypothetical protein